MMKLIQKSLFLLALLLAITTSCYGMEAKGTPMEEAINAGDIKEVRNLIEKGYTNTKGADGNSPLHEAIKAALNSAEDSPRNQQNQLTIVGLLIKSDALRNVKDKLGNTPEDYLRSRDIKSPAEKAMARKIPEQIFLSKAAKAYLEDYRSWNE